MVVACPGTPQDSFGLLRAAPAIGACVVGVYLASQPIRRHAGRIMFAGVAVFATALGSVAAAHYYVVKGFVLDPALPHIP